MANLSLSPEGISYEADDGTVVTGEEAGAAFDAEIDEQQALREKFAREYPKEWAEYCRRKEAAMRRFDRDRMRKAKVAAFRTARERGERASLDLSTEWTRAHVEPARVPQGRAPRAAENEHHRGSRRGERSRSSSSDDPDPDPEPRVCECGCGAPLEHLRADKRHLNDAHRAKAWRAAQAERELIRDVAQLAPESPTPSLCDHAECVRLRNGYYAVDPEVLAVWMEQCREHLNPERKKATRSPRESNGAEPIVVIDADGRRTEFSPQEWQRRFADAPTTATPGGDRALHGKE